MNPTYQIVYWRDIPSQVKVRVGQERVSCMLPERFLEAIDEAAMHARSTSEDAYLEEWRATEWQDAGQDAGQNAEGDPQELADRLAAELDEAYPLERLEALKENKGYALANR
ncbi:MAG TPA: virulence factor [Anaerolineales bacterium]